jgi:hypothetical protein
LEKSIFERNGKLRWNLKNLFNIRELIYKKIPCKKGYKQYVGSCKWILYGLMNSRIFIGFQLFSDIFHQALYIFWTIIVVVNLILQVGPEIFDQP